MRDAGYVDPAVVGFHDGFDNAQAQAAAAGGAGEGLVCLVKLAEDAAGFARGEADAVVCDGDGEGIILERGGDADVFFVAGIFPGVVEEVEEGGGEGVEIAGDRGQIGADGGFEDAAGRVCALSEGGDGGVDEDLGAEGLEIEGEAVALETGKGEEVADEAAEAGVLGGDELEVFAGGGFIEAWGIDEGIDEGAHGGERGLEFVGDGGDEVVLEAGDADLFAEAPCDEDGESGDEGDDDAGDRDEKPDAARGLGIEEVAIINREVETPAGERWAGGEGGEEGIIGGEFAGRRDGEERAGREGGVADEGGEFIFKAGGGEEVERCAAGGGGGPEIGQLRLMEAGGADDGGVCVEELRGEVLGGEQGEAARGVELLDGAHQEAALGGGHGLGEVIVQPLLEAAGDYLEIGVGGVGDFLEGEEFGVWGDEAAVGIGGEIGGREGLEDELGEGFRVMGLGEGAEGLLDACGRGSIGRGGLVGPNCGVGDVAGGVEAEGALGNREADGLGETEGGRGDLIRECEVCIPCREQLRLEEGELGAVGLGEGLAHGDALVAGGFAEEPEDAADGGEDDEQ